MCLRLISPYPDGLLLEMISDYDSLFTYHNLYLSYLKSRKNKRDKDEVIRYSLELENNLHQLEKRMRNRDFTFSGYYQFEIYEPKRRKIQAIHFEDRIIQHCLCDFYLIPLLERHLIFDNAATRVNKGTDFARNRVKHFMNLFYLRNGTNEGYVLKYDIHHYFPSISHSILKDKLSKIVLDKDILSYLCFLIDSYHEEEEDRGLPIGNQTSQCFGLLYLDKVDRIIKERYHMKYYSRYMDDGIIIHENKNMLKALLASISEQLEKDKLILNPKTRIYTLEQGFEYLGFDYCMKDNGKILQIVPKKKKERMLRYVKKRIKEDGEYDVSFCESYLKRGNNRRFLVKLKDTVDSYDK